jgi:nitrogen regulatory protein PII
MKMILIAYNQALDDEVMEALEGCCLENYTKWTGVLGKGSSSGPHLATHVWPKANNVLAVAADDSSVDPLLEQIRKLRAELGHEGVKAFVLPLEQLAE